MNQILLTFTPTDTSIPVLSIYSKGGGKHGRHGWVPVVNSVSSISFSPMQVYEYSKRRREFIASSPSAIALGREKTYSHITPAMLLCQVKHTPKALGTNYEKYDVSAEDMQEFLLFEKNSEKIQEVAKELGRTRRRKGTGTDEDHEDEED